MDERRCTDCNTVIHGSRCEACGRKEGRRISTGLGCLLIVASGFVILVGTVLYTLWRYGPPPGL